MSLTEGALFGATIQIQVVASVSFRAPFGLAYDDQTGTLWISTQDFFVNVPLQEMTTALVLTGATTPSRGAEALAWSGTQLVTSGLGPTIREFDPITGDNLTTVTLQGVSGPQPIDGLDFDHNEIWYSPDQGEIFRRTATGAPIAPDPWLGSTSGFSGVERCTLCNLDVLIAVNDAASPRQLCAYDIASTNLLGCAVIPNLRYEDLAFDGQYLYAADTEGNRIDKLQIQIDACPEPCTALLSACLAFAAFCRSTFRHIRLWRRSTCERC